MATELLDKVDTTVDRKNGTITLTELPTGWLITGTHKRLRDRTGSPLVFNAHINRCSCPPELAQCACEKAIPMPRANPWPARHMSHTHAKTHCHHWNATSVTKLFDATCRTYA